MADQAPPFLEILAAAEVHVVVFHRVTLHRHARRNSGAASPTPASNASSIPGLTRISALSNTMVALLVIDPAIMPAPARRHARLPGRLRHSMFI
jgi:hypothetical protein